MKKVDEIATVLIRTENLRPIIAKCFEKLSKRQWELLIQGNPDIETGNYFSNLLIEVIQASTVEVLNYLGPEIQRQTCKTPSIKITDAIQNSISDVLHVPGKACISPQLTNYIEAEVSIKSSKILSSASEDSKIFLEEPVSDISKFRKTVKNFIKSVAQGLRRAKSTLFGRKSYRKLDSPQSDSSDSKTVSTICSENKAVSQEDLKSTISKADLVTGIRDVLEKYSTENLKTASSSQNIQDYAEEIAQSIMNTLNCREPENLDSSENVEPKISFNDEQVAEKLEDFIETNKLSKKKLLIKSAMNKFKGLIDQIKKAFSSSDKKNVLQEPIPPTTRTQEISDEEYESIYSEIEIIYDQYEILSKSEKLREFSKKLTDKLMKYTMRNISVQIPLDTTRKTQSEPLLNNTTPADIQTRPPFSYDVLYAITETEVGKLCEYFLSRQSNRLDKAVADEVSSALSDIEEVVKKAVTSRRSTPDAAMCESHTVGLDPRATTPQDKAFIVTSENVQPIIHKYFNKISTGQWQLLSENISDSDTQVLFGEMLTEIIQSVSESSLDSISPKIKKGVRVTPSIIKFETSLCENIARALSSPETCESSDEVTNYIEAEAFNKTSRVLESVSHTETWPTDPAFNVNHSVSDKNKFCQMIQHVTECIKKFLSKIKTTCFKRCSKTQKKPSLFSSSSSEQLSSSEQSYSELSSHSEGSFSTDVDLKSGSCEELKCLISEPEVLSQITNVLESFSRDSPDSPTSPQQIQDVAENIVKDAMDSAHFCEPDEGSPDNASTEISFNMRQTIGKLKNVIKPNPVSEKKNFFESARTRFSEIIDKLKSSITSSHPKSKNAFEVNLSSCDPETFSDFKGSVPITTKNKQLSDLDYEPIHQQLEKIWSESHLEDNEIVQRFSKELTEKLYDHVMNINLYPLPKVPLGKSMSDTILSRRKVYDHRTGQHFAPEVLYSIAENETRRFIDFVLIWKQNENGDQNLSNRISSALSDIQDVFQNTVNSRRSTPVVSATLEAESPTPSNSLSSKLQTHYYMTALFRMLFSNSSMDNSSTKSVEVQKLISRLDEKIWEMPTSERDFAQVDHQSSVQLVKDMMEDLSLEFGSAENVLISATQKSAEFDEAIIEYLQTNLSVNPMDPMPTTEDIFFKLKQVPIQ